MSLTVAFAGILAGVIVWWLAVRRLTARPWEGQGTSAGRDSAGTIGFKGARKSTPFAATRAAETVASKVRKMGMQELEVRIKGAGSGREAAVNGLSGSGLRVTAMEDHTAVPHNGCRPRKKRHV